MNQTELKLFNLPNLITASNFMCGVLAIIAAFFGRIEISAMLLILGMIFDFFDGFVARKLGINSPLGKDLDSLADLVSFGLAPGVLMFITIELRLNGNLGATYLKVHDFQFNQFTDWLSFCALSIPFFPCSDWPNSTMTPVKATDLWASPPLRTLCFFFSFHFCIGK